MFWTKDSYEWRSEQHKKDFIEEIKRTFIGESAHQAEKIVSVFNSIVPPFRVTDLNGNRDTGVVQIVDSVGNEYNNEHIEQGVLFPHKYRLMFKKTARVVTPKESEIEDAEILKLLNCMEDFALIKVNNSGPATTKTAFLKLLRMHYDSKVNESKQAVIGYEKEAERNKAEADFHKSKLIRMGVDLND